MRAFAFILISFFSSFGDTLFLAGVPLYFYKASGGSIAETAYLPIVITIAIFLSKRVIFDLNKKHPLQLTAYGEILMGAIEILLIGIVWHYPSQWVILIGTLPLAVIYNVYAPAKFFRIQEYFFKEDVFHLTTWQSAANRLGTLAAIFLSGWIVVHSGIIGILAVDCASFLLFGGFALLYLRRFSNSAQPVSGNKAQVTEKHALNLKVTALKWLLPLISLSTFFVTWDRSSVVATAATTTGLSVDSLSIYKALFGAAGIILGVVVGKLGERAGLYAWCAGLFLGTIGIACIGGNPIPVAYFLFFIAGLVSCIANPVLKTIYSEVSRLGGDGISVSTGHWIYNSVLSFSLLPIGILTEKVHFLNALQISALAVAVIGALGGAVILKTLNGVPK